MTYNAYNFINSTFNESAANSVYWSNSELIIVILFMMLVCQMIIASGVLLYFVKRWL